jgi:AAA15 family ATPase/GTPase
MTTQSRITRVVLKNYKSIAACDVPLGPLTILVGPNGAGKSNFLDAMRFCRDALRTPLDEVFAKRNTNLQHLRRSIRSISNRASNRVPSIACGRLFSLLLAQTGCIS